MNKTTKLVFAALAATMLTCGAVGMAACQKTPEPLKDASLDAKIIADFTKTADDRKEVFASGSKGSSWENGEPFNVWWKPENVSFDGGTMSLAISEMTEKEQIWDEETETYVDCIADYYGAEARTEHYYGFGDFQVCMKPSAIEGTASTFFTCTGPYDKWYEEDGETVIKENKHDEIDIEFLGKDTTKVQFNYFAGGVGGHEYMYDLGFDASQEFHNYGFRWAETYITWFVDEKPVYRVDRKNGEAWPEAPGRVILNYWCATQKASAWMGEFEDDYSGRAEYKWLKSSAAEQPDPNTAHIKPPKPVEVPSEGWTDVSVDGFDGWGNYEIDKTDGLTISHNAVLNQWSPCGTNLEKSYSWIKFSVKNNDANEADIRIDIKPNPGKSAVEAVVSEYEGVTLNTTESTVAIKLGAGDTAEVVVKIKDKTFVNQFVVFLNSLGGEASATGSITFKNIKGIVDDTVTPPDPQDEVTLTVNDSKLTLEGNIGDDAYIVTADKQNAGINVAYNELKGNSYFNINAAVASIAKTHGKFAAQITNNGTETVNFRIDINSSTTVEKTTACNVSAKQDGADVFTDTTNGGSMFTVAAGKTVSVEVIYDASRMPTSLMFYFDSSKYDDDTTHSGNVTVFGCEFTGDVYEAPEPDVPVVPSTDPVSLKFESTEDYTVDKNGEAAATVTVEYTEREVGGTYRNIQAAVKPTATGKDTFSVKITNNGTTATKVRIDLIGDTTVGNTNVTNIAHTATGGTDSGHTDTAYGGTTITVGGGETVVIAIVYSNDSGRGKVERVQFYFDSFTYQDTQKVYSGNITLSEFRFAGGLESETPVDPVTPQPEGFDLPTTGWETVPDNFDGWEMYTLERLPYAYYNGVRFISKNTPVGKDDCCGMDLEKSYSFIKFAVKNEDSATAEIRIDFKQKNVENSGAVTNVTVNGTAVAVDAESNAVVLTLASQNVAELAIKLDPQKEVNQMVVFLNSLKEEGNPNSGKIIISDIIGVVNTAFSEAETPKQIPESGWESISADSAWATESYALDNTDGIQVTHDKACADYHCFGLDFSVNYSWIKFTVTNNGNQTAKMRFDIKDKSSDKNPGLMKGVYPVFAATLTKENKDGKQSKTASVILGAKKSVDVVFELEAQYFDQMVVFFDSLTDGNNAAVGDIRISALSGIVDPDIEHVDASQEYEAKLNFERGESDRYNIGNNNGTTTVTYENLDRKSYQNIQANISEFAALFNTLTLTITNNGSSDVLIRIAVCKNIFSNKLDNPEICGVESDRQQSSATNGVQTSENSVEGKRGTFLTIPAGTTTTVTIKYAPNQGPKQLTVYLDSCYQDGGNNMSGNITISDVKFSNT